MTSQVAKKRDSHNAWSRFFWVAGDPPCMARIIMLQDGGTETDLAGAIGNQDDAVSEIIEAHVEEASMWLPIKPILERSIASATSDWEVSARAAGGEGTG